MSPRRAEFERTTKETSVRVALDLDGSGDAIVRSGVGFLDHLLTALAHHAGFDMTLTCQGDLEIDDHHSVEDCALALGTAFDRALGERRGVRRFGHAYAPLDEALVRAVVDLSGRPFADVRLGLRRERLGRLSCENVAHVLRSFAMASRTTLHVRALYGENDHHRAEAAFKATAVALREAVRLAGDARVPSTKGVLA